jgi:hypothetical protein
VFKEMRVWWLVAVSSSLGLRIPGMQLHLKAIWVACFWGLSLGDYHLIQHPVRNSEEPKTEN